MLHLQRISSTLQGFLLNLVILGPLARPPIITTCERVNPLSSGPPLKGEDLHPQVFTDTALFHAAFPNRLLRSWHKSSGQQNRSRSDLHHFQARPKETSPADLHWLSKCRDSEDPEKVGSWWRTDHKPLLNHAWPSTGASDEYLLCGTSEFGGLFVMALSLLQCSDKFALTDQMDLIYNAELPYTWE